MKARKLLQESVNVEGSDTGAPYHIGVDLNDGRWGAQASRRYGLTLTPQGPNGFPTLTGTIPTLDLVKSFAEDFGAKTIILEPHESGTSAVFEA